MEEAEAGLRPRLSLMSTISEEGAQLHAKQTSWKLIFAQLYDLPRKKGAARIDKALTPAGPQDAAHHLVNTYSGWISS